MKYDGILFDLDGTMWSAVEALVDIWREVLAEACPEYSDITYEKMCGVMGLRVREIGAKLFPGLSAEKQYELMLLLNREEIGYLRERGGILYPELRETLAELKKTHRLFIVSNCHDGYIQSFLTAHDCWGFFEDFECDRTGLSKGGNNRLLIERCGLKNAIYVGDTQGDADSAKEAGIPFVYASYGFGQVDHFDYRLETFSDLLRIGI